MPDKTSESTNWNVTEEFIEAEQIATKFRSDFTVVEFFLSQKKFGTIRDLCTVKRFSFFFARGDGKNKFPIRNASISRAEDDDQQQQQNNKMQNQMET